MDIPFGLFCFTVLIFICQGISIVLREISFLMGRNATIVATVRNGSQAGKNEWIYNFVFLNKIKIGKKTLTVDGFSLHDAIMNNDRSHVEMKTMSQEEYDYVSSLLEERSNSVLSLNPESERKGIYRRNIALIALCVSIVVILYGVEYISLGFLSSIPVVLTNWHYYAITHSRDVKKMRNMSEKVSRFIDTSLQGVRPELRQVISPSYGNQL